MLTPTLKNVRQKEFAEMSELELVGFFNLISLIPLHDVEVQEYRELLKEVTSRKLDVTNIKVADIQLTSKTLTEYQQQYGAEYTVFRERYLQLFQPEIWAELQCLVEEAEAAKAQKAAEAQAKVQAREHRAAEIAEKKRQREIEKERKQQQKLAKAEAKAAAPTRKSKRVSEVLDGQLGLFDQAPVSNSDLESDAPLSADAPGNLDAPGTSTENREAQEAVTRPSRPRLQL